ncbi:hypothetical protein QEH54_20685, partial [Pelagicoccus sp. SDUM812003]
MNPTLEYSIPTLLEYNDLREEVGWGIPDSSATLESLKNALHTVCLKLDEELIGIGRIVGDGGLFFYV